MKSTKLLSASLIAASLSSIVPGLAPPAAGQAGDQLLGQVMLVGFTFCPRGWMEAAGQLLPISSNTALFSLYGCTFGGDCRTTFALPDLRGRIPDGVGLGPGLPDARLGERTGSPTTTLTIAQLPNHSHQLFGTSGGPSSDSPTNALLPTLSTNIYATGAAPNAIMQANAIGSTGGSQSFSRYQPSLTLRYCIATQGIFPSRP